MIKKNSVLPLVIIFIISVSINIFVLKSDIATDDTISQMISEKVFNYFDDQTFFLDKPNDFNNFYLLFDEVKLNTNNFINYFQHFPIEELDIKKVYPYINPMHEGYLRDYIGEITFINNNLEAGLNNLIEQYLNILDDYGLDEEINKVNVYGINIRIVLINTSNKSMYNFLSNNKKVKFSAKFEGPYYKIK